MYVYASVGDDVSAASLDRFAPRVLVGNALSGAPSPGQLGYFTYLVDPGDGTGIAAGLAVISALGFAADLCIQPGTYTRAAGLARFQVPAGCRVYGQAGVNIVTNDADDCIFELAAGASLERMTLTQRGTLAAAGSALVECPVGSATLTTRLRELVLTTPVSVRGAQLVGGDYEVASCNVLFTGGGAAPVGINVEGALFNPAFFNIHDCTFNLVNIGVRCGFTGGTAVRDSRIEDCRFVLAQAVVPIALGTQSENCTVINCVSRGSAATFPTNTGTGNNIAQNIWGA